MNTINEKSKAKWPKQLRLNRQPSLHSQFPENKNEDTNRINYQHFWKRNLPSFKDIKNEETLAKAISIIAIYVVGMVGLVFLTHNLIFAIGITFLILLGFVIIFHSDFFRLKTLFRPNPFTLCNDIIFWRNISDTGLLYMTHLKDNSTTGIKVFELRTLSENVRANFYQFTKALVNGEVKIPFTYQIIKKPKSPSDPFSTSNFYDHNSSTSFEIKILFALTHNIKGRLNRINLITLQKTLQKYASALSQAKISNLHHTKIRALQGLDLINAFRSIFLDLKDEAAVITEIAPRSYKVNLELLGKTIYILSVSIFLSLLITVFNLNAVTRFLIAVGSFIGLTSIWNRRLFSSRFMRYFFHSPEITTFDPFYDIQFYRIRRYPSTLFYQIDDSILGGIKINNLHHVLTPPYCKPDKFYEAITSAPLAYTITYQFIPIIPAEFDKEAVKQLKDSEKLRYVSYLRDNFSRNQWFQRRSGIWKTILTLSTSYSIPCHTMDTQSLNQIEAVLSRNYELLRITFTQNYFTYHLIPLKKTLLEHGTLFELVKHTTYRRTGSHLNYSLFQGIIIVHLLTIADIFKKGMETRIGSEFNTPIHLDNFITCGNTVNTEILEEEGAVGFTLEQLHGILITNGTQQSRDYTAMKLISELIALGYPAIIFDTTGEWSRLLTKYKYSHIASQFLHFKLNRTLAINPFISDIPYDKDNIRYLDFMFDAYALCYKKDSRSMELFRNSIQSLVANGEFTKDVPTIKLDLTTRKNFERSAITDMVLQFFKDFFPNDIVITESFQINSSSTTSTYEFITSDKTVILDISEILNRDTQSFYTFLILAKFIHYIHTGGRYKSKFIVIPNIDMAFENYYLDKHHKYDRIEKFFQPLLNADFGFIASTPQLHFLHENVFDFFNNFIAFKTTDKRDFAAMSTLMGLDSIHGKGMYSSTRKESFQMKYMSEMKPDEAIVKREDHRQPFPVRVCFQELQAEKTMAWEDLLDYMKDRGYNVEDTEQQLLARAQSTLFQRDFKDYASLNKPIMNFLDKVKQVQNIGNTTENDLKKQLYLFLKPHLKSISNSKARQYEIRNEIFNILLTQRYLIEAHPKRAGGGEAMHTSYNVGPYYTKVVDDFYSHLQQQGIAVKAPVEEISNEIPVEPQNLQEVEITEIKNDQYQSPTTNDSQLLYVFAEQFGRVLYYELHLMKKYLDDQQYHKVLEIAKGLFPKFLAEVFKSYYSLDFNPSRNELLTFLNELSKIEKFPLSYLELSTFLEWSEALNNEIVGESNLSEYVKNVHVRYNEIFNQLRGLVGV